MTDAVIKSGSVKESTVKKKKIGNSRVYFWASECKYSVILDTVADLDWKLVEDEKLEPKVNLFWIDVATIHEHFRTIQPWQCINHFPGMPNIARKNRMGQNLNRMQKLFPKEYSFYPRTWVLPGEMSDFKQQFDSNGVALNNKIFIIKPDAGCQGRGIFLTRTLDSVPMTENVVAQVYVKKPLLIEGFKFDLRIYCIVTSVKPLRMYLFQDGLVRMCTEEYVKPTKDNLGQSCMHLTNYAVNKHNENFHQPTGDTTDEQQDGSKRSVQWFLNWIREERGDAKADWMWKRIGVLCTRTLMAIMPTLSREYDQHFKSFTGIAVDPSKIGAASASTLPSASSSAGDGAQHGVDVESNTTEESDRKSTASPVDSAQDSSDPKMRGSRCFEILGFDIMIENNLNPILIEVNHLPSFGTDSKLDLDIKERLMSQVFSVLPVLPDDHAAYVAFHKAESERRLREQRAKNSVTPQQPLERKNVSNAPRRRDSNISISSSGNSSKVSTDMKEDDDKNSTRVSEEDEQQAENQQSEQHSQDGDNDEQADGEDGEDEEEDDDMQGNDICSPERIEEIKSILAQVYTIYSPEKLTKIDRLLSKYVDHEEEFLQFVFAKYGVDPAAYPTKIQKPKKKKAKATVANKSSTENGTHNGSGSEESAIDPETQSLTGNLNGNAANKSKGNNNNANGALPMKRYSRSLSPPRSQSSSAANSASNARRSAAAWKLNQPDEEQQLRAEVFAQHIPDENDEWLKFECEKLTQCTRIFPLPKRNVNSSGTTGGNERSEENEEEKEEREDNEEEDEIAAQDSRSTKRDKEKDKEKDKDNKEKDISAEKKKIASYEDILFQVFLQDKRQTMRLRCPLPNRAKADENSTNGFLPPLDPPVSSRSSVPSMGTGKGVVGWKAPPKPIAKEPVKQPTASQSESAKRLSLGLSSSKVHARSSSSDSRSDSTVAVVLDPNEPNSSFAVGSGNGVAIVPTEQWPSTKAHRLYEESRNNRMRIEASRANSSAVLRQQLFFFDSADNASVASNDTSNLAIPSAMGGNMHGVQNPVYFMPNGLPANAIGMKPNLAIAGASNMNLNAKQRGMAIPQQQFGAMPNGRGAEAHGMATKQEELLRQLFPSWF